MLEYLSRTPPDPEPGAPVLVLLHGRGADMGDLQGLAQVLSPRASLITPQAPHPGGPWGYGSGWAWYRYMGDDRADKTSLLASLRALEGFLSNLPETLGFPIGPLVLGGFSQGGTTSLAYALTHPGEVAALVNLSGFLPAEESLGVGPELLGGTPLFWAHGTADPAVPFALAIKGRERIAGSGGTMETRDYPMGHWVSPEEMHDLEEWLRRTVPGWETEPAMG